MDKLLRNSLIAVCVAAVILLGAAATILIQISQQLHRTPNLMLKVEATVDYAGRAAKNFDDATRVWKDASQTEANYLHNTLPILTQQVQTDLNSSNSLLISLTKTSDTLTETTKTLSVKADQTLSATNSLLYTTNQTVAGIQPTELAMTNTLFKVGTSLDLFNKKLADPNIDTMLFHFAHISATGDHMLDTANKVETKATHSYLYPSTNPIHKTWDYLSPFLLPAATVASRIVP